MSLEIFEDGVPPRFRLFPESGRKWAAHEVIAETVRDTGESQVFTFAQKAGFLDSLDEIPEPHAFKARLVLGHAGHCHTYNLTYEDHEHHRHDHTCDHDHGGMQAGFAGAEPYADAHEREHAEEIERRFAGQTVTTPQIIMFGLTGG